MGVIASNKSKLKKEFKKFGDVFKYVKHKGDWYIYERNPYKDDDGELLDSDEGIVHYEVVKALHKTLRGTEGSKGWLYPANSDWGAYGFTYLSRDKAENKFKQMTQ